MSQAYLETIREVCLVVLWKSEEMMGVSWEEKKVTHKNSRYDFQRFEVGCMSDYAERETLFDTTDHHVLVAIKRFHCRYLKIHLTIVIKESLLFIGCLLIKRKNH